MRTSRRTSLRLPATRPRARKFGLLAGTAALVLSACTTTVQGNARGPGDPAAVPPVAQVSVEPAANSELNPKTPIVVKVSKGKLTTVTVTNKAKGSTVKGSLDADGTTWTSSDVLGYASTYDVVADAVGTDNKPVEQKSSVKTLSPAAQTFPSLTPAPPGAGATFGVGQIIGVSFDHKITNHAAAEQAIKVTTTPDQPGAWHWIDDRTLHYRGPNYWQPNTTIKLDVNLYGVDLGSGVYGQTDRSTTYRIHDSWIAKADGSTDQMQIVHNGAVAGSMPISIGKDETPTHAGPHVISDKQQQVIMDSCTYGVCPPDPKAYHSTEYWAERISNDGEFVHENPNTVNQQGSTNVSHGCINLSPENAQAFFNQFGLGDVVEVTNTPGPILPIYDTYGDWELNWQQWQGH